MRSVASFRPCGARSLTRNPETLNELHGSARWMSKAATIGAMGLGLPGFRSRLGSCDKDESDEPLSAMSIGIEEWVLDMHPQPCAIDFVGYTSFLMGIFGSDFPLDPERQTLSPEPSALPPPIPNKKLNKTPNPQLQRPHPKP